MRKLQCAALGLLLLLPLTVACDTGTTGNAVATAVPTNVSGAATAAMTAASGAATAAAPTINGAATAAMTAISGAATAGTTAISGAATAATTALAGSMSAADQAYGKQVQDLATKMQNSPELSDAVKALTTAAAAGATGGTVDTAGLTAALGKASTFLTGIAGQATALQAPADMKPVQDELMKAITDWQGSLQAAQTAVGAQNWANATQAAGQMTQGAGEVAILIADLATRGIR